MTDAQWMELGRRALVACPDGWRKMGGLRLVSIDNGRFWHRSDRTRLADEDAGLLLGPDDTIGGWRAPDLRDPATMGCLLALVREAHTDGDIHCERLCTGEWACFDHRGEAVADTALTEAEALVIALESAPKRGDA